VEHLSGEKQRSRANNGIYIYLFRRRANEIITISNDKKEIINYSLHCKSQYSTKYTYLVRMWELEEQMRS